jgi:hypothetical protein
MPISKNSKRVRVAKNPNVVKNYRYDRNTSKPLNGFKAVGRHPLILTRHLVFRGRGTGNTWTKPPQDYKGEVLLPILK